MPFLSLFDPTFGQATLDAAGYIGGNHLTEGIDVLALKSEVVANGGLDDVLIEAKKCLSSLLHAGILTGEAGDEYSVMAVRIEFGVQSPLGEHGHLVGLEVVVNGSGPVLEREFGAEAALNDDVDFGTAGVRVWGVEAARTEEADGHANASADDRRI